MNLSVVDPYHFDTDTDIKKSILHFTLFPDLEDMKGEDILMLKRKYINKYLPTQQNFR